MSAASPPPPDGRIDRTARWLSIGTVGGALVVVGTLAGVAICLAEGDTHGQVAREVLQMTFPVVSTWVGTVLAYYFSRENYVAVADKNMQLLARDAKLQGIRVSAVMIPLAKMTVLRLDAAKAQLKHVLKTQILPVLGTTNRLPILDASEHPEAIVHRSAIDRFIVATGDAATLDQLLADPKVGTQVKSIVTVGPDANLSDAKRAMDAVPGCSDVFVTDNGRTWPRDGARRARGRHAASPPRPRAPSPGRSPNGCDSSERTSPRTTGCPSGPPMRSRSARASCGARADTSGSSTASTQTRGVDPPTSPRKSARRGASRSTRRCGRAPRPDACGISAPSR
jgi:hypothetical protein